MKNIKKIFALVLVALFGLTTNVKATSKWDVKRENIEQTTVDIKPTFIKEDDRKKADTVIYTIPENYDGKKIYINVSEDIKEITGGKYVPGESKPFIIKIVNNSKYTYNYVKNSFKVLTDDISNLGESDNYYNFDINGVRNGIYVKDTVSFDGQQIAADWSIYRTHNDAIKNLYLASSNLKREKINKTWKYVYYYNNENICTFATSWRSNVCSKMLTDEILGAELVAQGYENGIGDLNKYYLDHYNKVFNTNATKIEDLSDKAIYGYEDSLTKYSGGILNGNYVSIRETNKEVSELGYNWFYNKGLGLYPVTDANGNEYKTSASTRDKGFYIGNYMRNESTITEEVVTKDFGTINASSENSLTPIVMLIDFYNVTNAFSNMEFGFNLKFELAKETLYGKLIVNYVDEEGNKLAESIITEAEVDTPYKTEQKEFADYEFLTVDGNTEGKYINGTIEVTYIYTNAIGDIDVPEEPIEPPHTDAEVTTSNIIMYIEEDKKRK